MRTKNGLSGLALAVALLAAPNAFAADAAPEQNLAGERTDTVRLAAGITLLSAGGLAAVGGTVGYFALSASNGERCNAGTCVDGHKNGKTASILSMVLGGAGLAVGLPLILTADGEGFGIGKRKRRHAAVPEVRLGLGAGTATWSF
jgi:hypothetical protein